MKTATKLWVCFIVVLTIPIVAFSISYNQTQRIVTAKTKDYTYALLDQLREIIDAKWEKYITVNYRINQNATIKAMAYAEQPLVNTTYYSIWEVSRELRNYAISDDYIVELGIYFPRSDRMVNSYSQWDLQRLYTEFFSGSDQIKDFDHFVSLMEGATSGGVFLPPVTITDSVSQRKYTLPYVFKLPLDSTTYTEGYVFFFLDIGKFSTLISRVDVFQQGNVYVIDNGRVILQIGNMESTLQMEDIPDMERGFTQRDGMVIAHVASDLKDWVYLIEVPDSIIMDDGAYLQTTAILLVFVALLLGALVAGFFAIRTTKPVQRLMQILSDDGQSFSGNDFQYLEGSVRRLIANNTHMEEVLDRYGPILRMEFLGNLMRGEYTDDNEIRLAMDTMDFSLPGEVFLVLLAYMAEDSKHIIQRRLHVERQSDGARILLSGIIAEQSGRVRVCLTEKNKVAVLLCGAKGEADLLPELAKELAVSVQDRMIGELGVNVMFFGSSICTRPMDISAAFSEARSALEYFEDADFQRDVYWASLIPEQSASYHYPLDVQMRLVNLVSSAKEQEVLTLLDELYAANFQRQQLPHSERAQLLTEMRGTLLKLYHKYKLDRAELKVSIDDCNKGTKEVFRALRQHFKLLCRHLDRQNSEKNSTQLEQINAFVEENYTNSGLSLTMIGEHMGMDELTLSAFYKKKTGLSLVSRIEQWRMDEACRLLAEGKIPVAEIATAVGYNNDKSFRRAFKRFCGMSPMEYRNANRKLEQ